MIVGLSLVVDFRPKVPNLILVRLSQFHLTLLADYVVIIIMANLRRGGIDALDVVKLGTCSESAPL